ncbi:iron chelate uptake ABC transporter family permease subunit [Reinekea marinisedimentorum]|uniref:Iron complex transport system permease protein n=1 Tax=Reinekea marinisedimentorum TaxID=230495 RepID=A0A4R3I2J0_9GAMM|nr:iron chelate uptake ABC transporter family permease subunit [Reinekea marinisedimentorum]TCS38981.1 iron complex transport system permease protein [Reinekea marinisedimentorum]
MQNTKSLSSYPALLAGLTLLLALLFWWSLFSWSAMNISARDALDAVFNHEAGNIAQTIVRELRLPRALVAIVVGCAMAAAGAVMQGLTLNPLASPSVLGINAGAALGMALVTTLGLWQGAFSTSVAAVIGAALAWLIVMSLGSWKAGGQSSRLVLAGIAVSALCMALTKALVILHENQAVAVLSWLAGGFVEARWPLFGKLWPVAVPALLFTLAFAPTLNLLSLGDENASHLGVVIWAVRLLGSALVLVLVGWTISLVGAIGFVGLIVPHVARKLTGYDYRRNMPVAMLMGACLVLLADIVSRAIAFPTEVPAGAILALFGTPVFIYLVRSRI